jgi:hypothetical protein
MENQLAVKAMTAVGFDDNSRDGKAMSRAEKAPRRTRQLHYFYQDRVRKDNGYKGWGTRASSWNT